MLNSSFIKFNIIFFKESIQFEGFKLTENPYHQYFHYLINFLTQPPNKT